MKPNKVNISSKKTYKKNNKAIRKHKGENKNKMWKLRGKQI